MRSPLDEEHHRQNSKGIRHGEPRRHQAAPPGKFQSRPKAGRACIGSHIGPSEHLWRGISRQKPQKGGTQSPHPGNSHCENHEFHAVPPEHSQNIPGRQKPHGGHKNKEIPVKEGFRDVSSQGPYGEPCEEGPRRTERHPSQADLPQKDSRKNRQSQQKKAGTSQGLQKGHDIFLLTLPLRGAS